MKDAEIRHALEADAAASVMEKVEAVFDPAEGGPSLAELALGLLARQKASWPTLAEAYVSLDEVLCREIDCGGFSVLAQFNRRRMESSGASVDFASLKKRPCFLCVSHLPPAQRAVLYRASYLVLCNPAPIFPAHFTIAHLSHIPQVMDGRITDFLRLARELAPGFNIFYNGPRCGASAPDHLHFQAIPAGVLPIDRDASRPELRKPVELGSGVCLFRAEGVGREVWIIEGRDREAVGAALRRIVAALAQFMPAAALPDDEPMLNILGTHREGMWRVILFPRRKHRPDAFYREGEARLVLTPATVEMGGFFVAPLERDYYRLDAALVREIYEEVSLGDAEARKVFALSIEAL